MEKGKLLTLDDPKKVRDPRRVRGHLGVDVRSAIAAPLGDASNPTGALALYNHRSGVSFNEQDGALLKLVSANVSTELRVFESRRQRERAERLGSIGRLLSGVMHDLRTPLTVISGYVQLMAVSDDTQTRSQYAETIKEQFEIIGAMQRDLLAYARGETTLLIRKIYLSKFCEDIARQIRPELDRHGIVLEMEVRDTGIAFFDEQRMTRAIGNLVRNAVEAMEGGGTLRIVCDSEDDDLMISVADTGKGIPKRIRTRIFEPFVTAGKDMGTGLGLYSVKKIVDEHGGRIELQSSRKGTTFSVYLPGAMLPHSLRSAAITASRESPR
jgi:signal transduction histidine kinase